MTKFIDIFAGIGGMRIPFDELGYKCVFSSEIVASYSEIRRQTGNFVTVPMMREVALKMGKIINGE